MVFVCTAMGVLYVEHANVLELCYIELLSGDGSPYSILSDIITFYFAHMTKHDDSLDMSFCLHLLILGKHTGT